MVFILDQEKLQFEPKSHEYTFNGIKLHSVSSVIHHYTQPFDPDGTITARKAAENNITVEEQKKRWEKIGEESRNKGTAFHNDTEYYIKTKRIPKTENEELVRQFSQIKYKGALYSEVRLFNLNYSIAGTTDVIELFPDNSISLADLKTNQAKKMTWFSFKRKMLYPLDYLWDSVMQKYEIQLSIYAFMLEEAGWWIKDLTILHIDYDKMKIIPHPMKYRRDDVILMLEHFRENHLE